MPIRKFYRKVYRKNKKKARLLLVLNLLGLVFLIVATGFFLLFILYARDLPQPEKFTERQVSQSTKIYDRTGKVLLYEIYGEEKRTIVPLSAISDQMKEAVIATEDANFYHHVGIDPAGMARSLLMDVRVMKPTYGGSTIPQQLIRSALLTDDKTIKRKVREIILAIELDRRYPKDQILEWYLNQIPFGSNTYGVEAASQTYFLKPASQLSLAEAATLTALIRAPSYLSPYGEYKDQLLIRKNYVLDRMVKEHYITRDQAESAKKEEVKFSDPQSIQAPHFVIYVIEHYLKPRYGNDLSDLKTKGLKIYTTLDWDLQQAAEQAVTKGIENDKQYNAHNASLVSIDPKTGDILAMVGSADWFAEPYPQGCITGKNCLFEPKFNTAIGHQDTPGRQPGSAFKPFVYATAFEKGATDQTKVTDELTNFGNWGGQDYIPQNYDGKFRGEVTLRTALAQSLNVPAVKVLLNIAGLDDSVKTAQSLGITTLQPPFGPSIVLGGWEVNLLEMTSAYGVFANDGLRVPPSSVLKIEDNQGNVLEDNSPTAVRVLDNQIARMVNDVLSDNDARAPMFGAHSHLFFDNYQVAAKTGTTDNFKDAWAIGYTPSISAGVWVGNNNNESMIKAQPAATVAGPIFHEFMVRALAKYPQEGFVKPQTPEQNSTTTPQD